MRLLHLSVPKNDRDPLLAELDDRGLGYAVMAGAGPQSDRLHVEVAVPADAVEHVLDDLGAAGYEREGYTASLDAEFATFRGVDEVQNRWSGSPNRIAPATLRSKAKGLRRNSRSYLWMMVLSAIVATAGLLIGSPAIVVGSMVIAPIVSPMLTASVGAIRDDREMLATSVRQQTVGLAVAIGTAAVFAFVVRTLTIATEPLAIAHLDLVAVRLAPSVLAIVVGLAAGAAGAYGLATTGRVTIVGVMIAAALIPTAAAAGLGIAWENGAVALGATSLLIVTVVMVNVGATLMLLYLGYRPDTADPGIFGWDSARNGAAVVAALAIVVAVVATIGVGAVGQSSLERGVHGATTDVIEGGAYPDLAVEDVAIEYRSPERNDAETLVTVTVARTGGEDYPALPGELERAIEDETDERVLVQVRFVDYERAESR